MTYGFNNLAINEVSSFGVRALMAARLDNSENWVTDYSTIRRGNSNDILTELMLIVQITQEPPEDKKWELDLT